MKMFKMTQLLDKHITALLKRDLLTPSFVTGHPVCYCIFFLISAEDVMKTIIVHSVNHGFLVLNMI